MNEMATGQAKNAGCAPGGAEGLQGALSVLVDELAHGVLVASGQGLLLHANEAARRELARRDNLSLHEGRLQARDARQCRELLHALARGADGWRSMLTLHGQGGSGLGVAVLPLQCARAPQPGTVALVLSRAAVCDTLMLCFFARAHGLTHSEEQVLAILCQGHSAPQAARQLKVAVSTVRSHVRSVCTKTQTNGVRALLGRVAVLPPLGHRLHGAVH